jgi:hypothetical protein
LRLVEHCGVGVGVGGLLRAALGGQVGGGCRLLHLGEERALLVDHPLGGVEEDGWAAIFGRWKGEV